MTGVDVEADDAGRGRRAAGAVVDDGAQRDGGAGCGETAVEALGELRAIVGGLCGEGQREHRDGAEAGGAAEALVEMSSSRCTSLSIGWWNLLIAGVPPPGRDLGATTGLFTDA